MSEVSSGHTSQKSYPLSFKGYGYIGGFKSMLWIQIHGSFNVIWQAESRSVLVIVIPDGGKKIPFEGFINFR